MSSTPPSNLIMQSSVKVQAEIDRWYENHPCP